jgi:hypothetical protein
MARAKYKQWLEPENLLKITNWAANGCTHEEIAHNMGITRSTLQDWLTKFQDISDAIKEGREMAIEAVENALFRRASGQCTVKETTEITNVDGEVTTKTVTKELPPDTGALIFFLKNRMPEKYSDRRVMEVEPKMPTITLGVEPKRAK